MEPFWVGELRKVLEAAGREDLMKVVIEEFIKAQKNAAWTVATACKGYMSQSEMWSAAQRYGYYSREGLASDLVISIGNS